MMQIKRRIAGTGELIVLQSADGEVAGGMEARLLRIRGYPAIRRLVQAFHVLAIEEVFDVRRFGLVAPEEADVTGEGPGVVFEAGFGVDVEDGVVDGDPSAGWNGRRSTFNGLGVWEGNAEIDLRKL